MTDARSKPMEAESMLRRRAEKEVSPAPRRQASVHGFVGAKGGVGTTTAALEFALSRWRQGATVIAVELRSCRGSFFEQTGTRGPDLMPLLMADALALTAARIEACLVEWYPKLDLLCAPPEVHQLASLPPLVARMLVEKLRGLAEEIVLDLDAPPSLSTQAALGVCDRITVVSDIDPASAQGAKRVQDYIRACNFPAGRAQFHFVDKAAAPPPEPAAVATGDPEEGFRSSLLNLAGVLTASL